MISFLFIFLYILSQGKFFFRFGLRSILSATPVFALHLRELYADMVTCIYVYLLAYEPLACMLVYFLFFDWPRPTGGSYVSLWDKIFTKVPHGRESKVYLAVRPQGSWLPHFPTLCASYVALLCCCEREKNN